MNNRVAIDNTASPPYRMKLAKPIWGVIFLAPLMSFAMDFSEAEKLVRSYDPATRSYLYERLTYESANSLDEKRVCSELPGGGVTQVLRINQDGAIDLIISNVKTEQSDCFEKLYLGRSFKAPPTAPIYIKHKVGYSSK